MRDLDDTALERRLREVLEEHLGALPLDLTADALDRRRADKGAARRFGRGRGISLLAAAALLLVSGALAAGSGLLRQPTVVPPAPSLAAVVTASPDATSSSPSEVARPSATRIRTADPGGTWIRTGSMITPRYYTVAVRLADGRVLVTGGVAQQGESLTSAELYDPTTGTWSATGSMIHPLGGIPATLLRDGRVLVGDHDPTADVSGAELYDPATGTWSATGKPEPVFETSATVLNDGKVLVTSGTSQLYDPASGNWTATGKMVTWRYHTTATLLPDGRVLVAGGDVVPDKATDTAELYDPTTGSWTATMKLRATGNNRFDNVHATLLRDGTVLVVRSGYTARYDPASETWTYGPTPTGGIYLQSLTSLVDGTLLATAFLDAAHTGNATAVADVYDAAAGSWTQTGWMLPTAGGVPPLDGATVTPLLDGTVLVTAGGPSGAIGSAQLYIPAGVAVPTGLAPVPSPTPTPSPTPQPTPYPPMSGPVPNGARPWTVKVVNKRSVPATFDLAQESADGIGPICGSVTPNVVPANTTENVTFELPQKGVECWIYINPGPGDFIDPGWETSNKPMPGYFELTDGEGGPNGGGQNAWVSP